MDGNPVGLGITMELAAKDAEIARLRAALTPIINHAAAHDYAPPIRLSVAACRAMLEAINGDN